VDDKFKKFIDIQLNIIKKLKSYSFINFIFLIYFYPYQLLLNGIFKQSKFQINIYLLIDIQNKNSIYFKKKNIDIYDKTNNINFSSIILMYRPGFAIANIHTLT